MNNVQNYGMANYQVKNNSIMFKASTKQLTDKAVDYLTKHSSSIEAWAAKADMEGRSLLKANLVNPLDMVLYESARKFPGDNHSAIELRRIANCFRYGNDNEHRLKLLEDGVFNKIQKFMSGKKKKISKEDLRFVVAGDFDKTQYARPLPLYYDETTKTTFVFTTKGKPQCKMQFITDGTDSGIMTDFKVTEVFVPEKGKFVKTEKMYAPLEKVLNRKTYTYEKGTEPFFPMWTLVK